MLVISKNSKFSLRVLSLFFLGIVLCFGLSQAISFNALREILLESDSQELYSLENQFEQCRITEEDKRYDSTEHLTNVVTPLRIQVKQLNKTIEVLDIKIQEAVEKLFDHKTLVGAEKELIEKIIAKVENLSHDEEKESIIQLLKSILERLYSEEYLSQRRDVLHADSVLPLKIRRDEKISQYHNKFVHLENEELWQETLVNLYESKKSICDSLEDDLLDLKKQLRKNYDALLYPEYEVPPGRRRVVGQFLTPGYIRTFDGLNYTLPQDISIGGDYSLIHTKDNSFSVVGRTAPLNITSDHMNTYGHAIVEVSIYINLPPHGKQLVTIDRNGRVHYGNGQISLPHFSSAIMVENDSYGNIYIDLPGNTAVILYKHTDSTEGYDISVVLEREIYHGITEGLFGVFDDEYQNDLYMSSGYQATSSGDLHEFMKSWNLIETELDIVSGLESITMYEREHVIDISSGSIEYRFSDAIAEYRSYLRTSDLTGSGEICSAAGGSHYKTFDGYGHDMYGLGVYKLASSLTKNLEIQTAIKKLNGASVNKAVAARIHGDIVIIELGGVKVNGEAIESVPPSGIVLSGGGILVKLENSWKLQWHDGSVLTVTDLSTYLNVWMFASNTFFNRMETKTLCGSFDLSKESDREHDMEHDTRIDYPTLFDLFYDGTSSSSSSSSSHQQDSSSSYQHGSSSLPHHDSSSHHQDSSSSYHHGSSSSSYPHESSSHQQDSSSSYQHGSSSSSYPHDSSSHQQDSSSSYQHGSSSSPYHDSSSHQQDSSSSYHHGSSSSSYPHDSSSHQQDSSSSYHHGSSSSFSLESSSHQQDSSSSYQHGSSSSPYHDSSSHQQDSSSSSHHGSSYSEYFDPEQGEQICESIRVDHCDVDRLQGYNLEDCISDWMYIGDENIIIDMYTDILDNECNLNQTLKYVEPIIHLKFDRPFEDDPSGIGNQGALIDLENNHLQIPDLESTARYGISEAIEKGSVSISFWVNVGDVRDEKQTLVRHDHYWRISLTDTGSRDKYRISFEVTLPNGGNFVEHTEITKRVWNHVVFILDVPRKLVSLFVDQINTEIGELEYSSHFQHTGDESNLLFGEGDFVARIKDFRIYDVALSQVHVNDIYSEGYRQYTGLLSTMHSFINELSQSITRRSKRFDDYILAAMDYEYDSIRADKGKWEQEIIYLGSTKSTKLLEKESHLGIISQINSNITFLKSEISEIEVHCIESQESQRIIYEEELELIAKIVRFVNEHANFREGRSNQEIQEIETILNLLDEMKTRIEKLIEETFKSVENCKSQIGASEAQISEAHAQIADMNSQITNLGDQILTYTASIDKAQEHVDMLTQEAQEKLESIENAKNSHNEWVIEQKSIVSDFEALLDNDAALVNWQDGGMFVASDVIEYTHLDSIAILNLFEYLQIQSVSSYIPILSRVSGSNSQLKAASIVSPFHTEFSVALQTSEWIKLRPHTDRLLLIGCKDTKCATVGGVALVDVSDQGKLCHSQTILPDNLHEDHLITLSSDCSDVNDSNSVVVTSTSLNVGNNGLLVKTWVNPTGNHQKIIIFAHKK